MGRTPASQVEVQAVEEVSAECLHPELEILGSASNATYRRCLGCYGVIVSHGGRLWLLSSESGPKAAGGDESETDRKSAEEGRYRSSQAKEVKAVAAAYAIFAVVAQVLLAINRWALF